MRPLPTVHALGLMAATLVLATIPARAAAQSTQAEFRVTVSGAISGGPETRTNAIRSSSRQVVISQPGIALDLTFFQAASFRLEGDGADCFPLGLYGGADDPNKGGSLAIQQARDGSAYADFWFTATGHDGASEVKYRLELFGSFVNPSDWLPAAGSANVVSVERWAISSEGKGKNLACTGSGTFMQRPEILVERLR